MADGENLKERVQKLAERVWDLSAIEARHKKLRGTGWMCGGVTGGLIALGLFFGSEDLQDYDAAATTIDAARHFMSRFEEQVGAVLCPKIQEDVVFGRYLDPTASPENVEAFAQAQGFEKCSLLPGIGARLAAEIIIESLV
jgi:hypothetical protein